MSPNPTISNAGFQGMNNVGSFAGLDKGIMNQEGIQGFLSFLELLLLNLFGGQNDINPQNEKNKDLNIFLVTQTKSKNTSIICRKVEVEKNENTDKELFNGGWIQLFYLFLNNTNNIKNWKELGFNSTEEFKKEVLILIKKFFSWLREKFNESEKILKSGFQEDKKYLINQLESMEKIVEKEINKEFNNVKILIDPDKSKESYSEEVVLKVVQKVFKKVDEKKEIIKKLIRILNEGEKNLKKYEDVRRELKITKAEIFKDLKGMVNDESEKIEIKTGKNEESLNNLKSVKQIKSQNFKEDKLSFIHLKEDRKSFKSFSRDQVFVNEKRGYEVKEVKHENAEVKELRTKDLRLLSQTYQSLEYNTSIKVNNHSLKLFTKDGLSSEFLQFVKRFTAEVYPQGEEVAIIDLEPPDLGKMHLEVKVKHREVEVLIKVEKPEVLHELQAHLHHIKQGLEEMGFQLKDTNLSLASGFEGGLLKEGFSEGQKENRGFELKEDTTEIITSKKSSETKELRLKNEKGRYYYIV